MMLHLMLAVIVFWEKIVYNSLTRKWPGNAWWPGGASAFTKALLPVHPQNNKNRKTTRNCMLKSSIMKHSCRQYIQSPGRSHPR